MKLCRYVPTICTNEGCVNCEQNPHNKEEYHDDWDWYSHDEDWID